LRKYEIIVQITSSRALEPILKPAFVVDTHKMKIIVAS